MIERAESGFWTVAAPELVDDLDHQRPTGVDRSLASGGFADLVLAVAVDLLDGDLLDQVLLEERDQVVAQFVAIVAGGALLDLEALGIEPVGGERQKVDVLLGRLGDRVWLGRAPGAKLDVAQHDRELTICPRVRPAILRAAERDVPPLAIGAEPQRKARLLGRRLHDAACDWTGHQRRPRALARAPITGRGPSSSSATVRLTGLVLPRRRGFTRSGNAGVLVAGCGAAFSCAITSGENPSRGRRLLPSATAPSSRAWS